MELLGLRSALDPVLFEANTLWAGLIRTNKNKLEIFQTVLISYYKSYNGQYCMGVRAFLRVLDGLIIYNETIRRALYSEWNNEQDLELDLDKIMASETDLREIKGISEHLDVKTLTEIHTMIDS